MSDFGLLVAQYNSSLPTLTSGQYTGLQVDVNGRLLVQADVSVLVDFLGLNGASDNANILIVGTEDGTSGGTAHAVRLSSNGSVVIDDGGGSITVDASDLDIRDLDAGQDNIAISDGTDQLEINGDGSINAVVTATDLDIRDLDFATDSVDVSNSTNVAVVDGGGSLTVDATDLDIRDLTHVSDSIKIGDGTDFVAVNNDGSLNITDNGGSLTVDATDLDIRDLDFATDSVDVSNSTNVAVVDGGGSLTVDAVDLDIRDLDASQDNVAISDGTDQLEINADGSINVNATIAAAGTEEYAVTDNFTAAADGLATITASGTPWVDVASIAVGAGETLYLYGYEWCCDANANARIITDDTTDIIVYKQSLNSSSQPNVGSFFSEPGRIEIPGAASLSVKLQIKKRSVAGGDALGSGSLHARLLT